MLVNLSYGSIADGWTTSPSLPELVNALEELSGAPVSDATPPSSLTDIINALSATISADGAHLLPIADTATALLVTLPDYEANIFVDQFDAGNLLGAIALPIAADVGLIRLALTIGIG